MIGTAPVAAKAAGVSIPGTCSTNRAPGLNPSLPLMSVGSIWTPDELAGVDAAFRLRRRPVSVDGSAFVK